MYQGEEGYFELAHHEDELINHRLTWLIGSQSLLFAGYAVLLTVEKDKLAASIEKIQLALYWLPFLGISVALLILVGIVSAVTASCILKVRFRRPLGYNVGRLVDSFAFPCCVHLCLDKSRTMKHLLCLTRRSSRPASATLQRSA